MGGHLSYFVCLKTFTNINYFWVKIMLYITNDSVQKQKFLYRKLNKLSIYLEKSSLRNIVLKLYYP
jgi:hypothetical protein